MADKPWKIINWLKPMIKLQKRKINNDNKTNTTKYIGDECV